MKKTFLFGVVAAFCMLSALTAGCQYIKGMPSGAFPNSVGWFSLDGYGRDPDDRDYGHPGDRFPKYRGFYKSSDGARVTIYLSVYPKPQTYRKSPNEIKKVEEQTSSTITIEGDKEIQEFNDKKDGTYISWEHDNWDVGVRADDTATAREFVENLPYK